MGLLKGHTVRRLVLRLERWMMRRFDVVSTISGQMRCKLEDKGVAQAAMYMMPNWVDIDAIHPMDDIHPLPGAATDASGMRASLGLRAEHVVCLFSGTINRKQGLSVVVDAARQLAGHPTLRFVICGNGEFRSTLEAAAAGLDNLCFIDLQPLGKLNALLNMADIHLLPQLRGAADLVMPSKLGGMLASGRPVVAGAEAGTEIATVVSGRGCIVEPENADALVAALLNLASSGEQRVALGAAARRYAEECLDREGIMQAMARHMQGLMPHSP
jgi:colanic acid biosynthesis glycosyl transferase WcaI